MNSLNFMNLNEAKKSKMELSDFQRPAIPAPTPSQLPHNTSCSRSSQQCPHKKKLTQQPQWTKLDLLPHRNSNNIHQITPPILLISTSHHTHQPHPTNNLSQDRYPGKHNGNINHVAIYQDTNVGSRLTTVTRYVATYFEAQAQEQDDLPKWYHQIRAVPLPRIPYTPNATPLTPPRPDWVTQDTSPTYT